jgi:hypothetical protein
MELNKYVLECDMYILMYIHMYPLEYVHTYIHIGVIKVRKISRN